MNVFIPHKKDFNIYFDEIMNQSSFNYVFGTLEDYNPSFQIVNIQFPEAIFSWEQPSNRQLEELEVSILEWKQTSKIVLILNDHQSHYDKENKFKELFKLIHKYTDAVIHLGNYSLQRFKSFFSENCMHQVINHATYDSLLSIETKSYEEEAEVDFKDKYIVSAVGNIRSLEEAKFVLKVFKKLSQKNKYLVVPKMFNFLKLPLCFPYRFRKIYWYFIEKWYCFPLNKDQYFFKYNHIEYPKMVDLVQKSSLMIIPRLKSLNSGLVYLGLTFNKSMLIPKVGNLTEFANYFNFPLLDISKSNYDKVIAEIIKIQENDIFISDEYKRKKEEFHPRIIAKEYETFFKSLMN